MPKDNPSRDTAAPAGDALAETAAPATATPDLAATAAAKPDVAATAAAKPDVAATAAATPDRAATAAAKPDLAATAAATPDLAATAAATPDLAATAAATPDLATIAAATPDLAATAAATPDLAATAAATPELATTAAARPDLAATAAADPLGATATSGPGTGRVGGPSGSLGRYTLERELGAGGMGVVHAAFDPDLERRVALKVLKGHTTDEARQRLLREARAMAKLGHPNVVTVYEVGNAAGRDFVAMELIDGGSLEHWLRAKPRGEREIIHAYLAAGRGLAAAHAAGLVHRDFKPHNVLRDASGRVAVTDFGLVVGVGGDTLPQPAAAIALAPAVTSATTGKTPSSLSGLTATGAVMGTPAYMAPEQWEGTTAGPATDQFAFCVALWEALAGERPYRGSTLDELQESLDRGPTSIDETKVPRRLRKILKRGLDPDPKKRWPSMDELLAAIARAERRPAVLVGLGGVALLGIALVIYFGSRHPARGCEPPIKKPGAVWSPSIAAQLGPAQHPNAVALDSHLAQWQEIRGRSCKIEGEAKRAAQLACLDGVLVRIDLVTQAMLALHEQRRVDAVEQLVDPADCEREHPPRLSRESSPAWRDVMAAWLHAMHAPNAPMVRATDVDALIAATAKAPCASAGAHLLAAFARTAGPQRTRELDDAARNAELCSDDRVSAEVAIDTAVWAYRDLKPDSDVKSSLQRAEAAIANLPELGFFYERLAAEIDTKRDDLAHAIEHAQRALDLTTRSGHLTSQLAAALDLAALLQLRASADDMAGLAARLDQLASTARAGLAPDDELVREIDRRRALWQFSRGDVEGAQQQLLAVYRPGPIQDPVTASGRVVDAKGAPVPSATVAGGLFMEGSSVTIASAKADALYTKTDADGRFTFEVPRAGVVLAQLADQRSIPVLPGTELTLTLAPTSRVEGTVDLHGHAPTLVKVMIRDQSHELGLRYYGVEVPVHADGTFATAGVPRGTSIVQTVLDTPTGAIATGVTMQITEPVVTDVHLEVADSHRAVHVIARSTIATALGKANIAILPGRVASTNLVGFTKLLATAQVKEGQPTADDDTPDLVKAQAKPGDLYATIKTAPAGEISACAIGYPPDAGDPRVKALSSNPANLTKIPVACTTVDANAQVIVVDVPPWPRLD